MPKQVSAYEEVPKQVSAYETRPRMHIHEAMLTGSSAGIAVLGIGAVGTCLGTAAGLRRLEDEQIPRVAVVTSAFFVVSLIHVPLGVTSVHLVLNGLVGLVLGWAAFPALLVALLLQALLFGYGGLLALGINTLTMALPGVICYYLFGPWLVPCRDGASRMQGAMPSKTVTFLAGSAAGFAAVLLGALLTATALWLSGEEFELLAGAVLGMHTVVAIVEGLITGSVVLFLRRVRPELLMFHLATPCRVRRVADE
jgi:cobalt/nickel transport system permease protein